MIFIVVVTVLFIVVMIVIFVMVVTFVAVVRFLLACALAFALLALGSFGTLALAFALLALGSFGTLALAFALLALAVLAHLHSPSHLSHVAAAHWHSPSHLSQVDEVSTETLEVPSAAPFFSFFSASPHPMVSATQSANAIE